MTNHTPGPWRVEESTTGAALLVIAANGLRVADIQRQSRTDLRPENARLIAAAPALLEAAEAVLAAFEGDLVDHPAQNTLDALEAAIARAKGESE